MKGFGPAEDRESLVIDRVDPSSRRRHVPGVL